jgi:hypothetical protein
MAVTALVLREAFFRQSTSHRFKYVTLAVLFVNISIGGTLTHFAAPPVVMVAHKWGWDTVYMLTHFGLKAALAVLLNTLVALFILRKEISKMPTFSMNKEQKQMPAWIILTHVLFLAGVVLVSHHMVMFVSLLLLFLGVHSVTREYQNVLKIRESLMVGFFLGGLVVLGSQQSWWLQPLLTSLGQFTLYIGATLLTGITDNAALTYLGSQVEGLSNALKYSLVSGAVTGGGLTIIANAPNPVGYAILKDKFGVDGLKPMALLWHALLPTVIVILVFWFLGGG